MKITQCKKQCKTDIIVFEVGAKYNYDIIESYFIAGSLYPNVARIYISFDKTDYLHLSIEHFQEFFLSQEEIRKKKLFVINNI